MCLATQFAARDSYPNVPSSLSGSMATRHKHALATANDRPARHLDGALLGLFRYQHAGPLRHFRHSPRFLSTEALRSFAFLSVMQGATQSPQGLLLPPRHAVDPDGTNLRPA